MKKLTLVIDERKLSTICAALFLLQEQADSRPEDLAEMLAGHGRPMTQIEIERLSHRLGDPAGLMRDHADWELCQDTRVVEVDPVTAAAIARDPA